MDTRHSVEGYFGNEFRAICNHCGSYGSLKSQDLNIWLVIFAFF